MEETETPADPLIGPIDPLIGRLLDERYRVTKLLGRGGMGRVYDAVQVELGRRVALKVLAPELAKEPTILERFRREAIAAAMLGHPHIVDVTDFVVPKQGPPFLVMERLVGEGLMDVLQQGGMLEVERAVRITVQLLDALQEAHEAGIVHRDLKPANVFLVALAAGQEMVKLLDFGIAKLRDAGGKGRLTAVGEMVGTPRFAAPEQLKGGEVDARTDVYGAGVLLYGMLTGRPPFPGPTADLIRAVLEDDPPDVRVINPAVEPALAAVVQKAMSKRSADRFASAREMIDALGGARFKGADEDAPRESAVAAIEAAKKERPSSKRAPKSRAPSIGLIAGGAMVAGLALGGLAVGASVFFVMSAGEPEAAAAAPTSDPPPVTPAATAPVCAQWIEAACSCPGVAGQNACATANQVVSQLAPDAQASECSRAIASFVCPPTEEARLVEEGVFSERLVVGGTRHFALQLRGGVRTEIWMTSEALDAYLVLRDPEGVVVAINDDAVADDSGTDAQIVYFPRTSGRFQIEARAREPQAGGGEFDLIVALGEPERTRRRRRPRTPQQQVIEPWNQTSPGGFRPNPPAPRNFDPFTPEPTPEPARPPPRAL